MKTPQAFLHFVLKVITQENGLFCGKADNFFPFEGLSLLEFSAEDNTNTWVTKHIPSFKYFQVIICLCMLLCLNQALWVLQTGRNRGGGGQWTPRARTEIEGNDQFVDQADMDTCFPLETTSMHQRTDLITYSWVWTRVIWVLLSWNSRKDSKMALCFLAEHHTVLLPVFLMPKITAES